MPVFLSEEEFSLISNDAVTVAERADSFIRDLRQQLDFVRAEADAKSIAEEQNCALLEQKYEALYSEFTRLQYENAQLSASTKKSLSELADAQAEKHQLHIKAIGKDGEIEKLSLEVAELHVSKRQLLELVNQKDAEIRERNSYVSDFWKPKPAGLFVEKLASLFHSPSPLGKLASFSSSFVLASNLFLLSASVIPLCWEERIMGGVLAFSPARICREKEELLGKEEGDGWEREEALGFISEFIEGKFTGEKELLEKQNVWLDEELTRKANSLFELRRTQMDAESDASSKIADLERQVKEYSISLNHSKERAKDLELRVKSLEEDLRSSKDISATHEEHFNAELSTVNKLVELYKASSEEWSKKAGELDGVIKALETHLSQVEDDYKEKLDKEASLRKDLEIVSFPLLLHDSGSLFILRSWLSKV
ncbi:Nuclear-pore anchor [Dendrobium catenatum]|uniref:Nuclear-pore anchor n=1 Tax=Dendrobium catenatum TaxID=906689 RepID=A0A2I0VRZ3_9ASPA|nr:Nuclear-pore anchor [Dendrobium catenatum]